MAPTRKQTPFQQLPRFPLAPACVQTLLRADEFRTTLLEHIARASRRIYITALYLQDDQAGQEILAGLEQAKIRHPELDIAVLVDWHRAQRGLIGAGKQQGNAAWYRTFSQQERYPIPVYGVPVQTRELFGVLHLKGFVIDDTVLYSGASLNDVYLQKHDKYRQDRYHLLHSAELANCLVQFTQEHLLASPAVHRLDQENCPTTKSLRKEIRTFRRQLPNCQYDLSQASPPLPGLAVTPIVGIGRNNLLNQSILDLLNAAERKITICTPYFNPPKVVSRTLRKLLSRGVQIEIIVGDKIANDFFIPPTEPFKLIGILPYLYEVNLRKFAKKYQQALRSKQLKLQVWRAEENSFHLKGIWIDDRLHLITGNNLNPRAFNLDLENALLIHDPYAELQAQKQAELAHILQHCTAIQQYQQLDSVQLYPDKIRKLLTRLSRARIDRLLYRIL